MIMIRIASVSGMIGGTGLLAQTMPMIPEDLKTWPVTAILGAITLSALALCFFVVRKMFEVQSAATAVNARVCELQVQTNVRLDRLCEALDRTNRNLVGRPCMHGAQMDVRD